MIDQAGKTNEVVPTTERVKPELITIGNRQISSTGRWNDGVMADYLTKNGQAKWVTIGELAKVAWGQNTITTKDRARRCLSRLWHYLLVERGQLLVIEYAAHGHHRAQAAKLYDPRATHEREIVEARLTRMSKTNELTQDRYERALGLLSSSPGQ